MSAAVVDTSPLVVLAKVGRLDLLLDRPGGLFIPTTVAREILAEPVHDSARLALKAGPGSWNVRPERAAKTIKNGGRHALHF